MILLLYILTALAFFFVIFTLIKGGIEMGKKAEGSREKSNKWMQRRVMGQAVAVALLILTVYVQTRGG